MYKPFNLQAALDGAPVVTRDGRPVKIAGYNEQVNSLLGWVANNDVRWTGGGKSNQYELDLFMAPTTRKEWIVIYGLPNDRRYTAGPFQTDNGPNVFIQTLSSEYKSTIHEITITE
jgi:hypothetical protein